MSKFSFYDCLRCILSNYPTQFIIQGSNFDSDFPLYMMALPKLDRYILMFCTREFNTEIYQYFEGSPVKSDFEEFIEHNLSEDEYNDLKTFIFRVKCNAK